MDVPGFTAEASVYKSNRHFSTDLSTTSTSRDRVVPMLPLAQYACKGGCGVVQAICTSECAQATGGAAADCAKACAAFSQVCQTACGKVGPVRFFGTGIGSELIERIFF